jgi:hypothetical protein
MTEPPEHDPAPTPAGADPTRDMRWSPLPDVTAARSPGSPVFDQPTDDLTPPRPPRERTIAFASPEMAGGRPTPTIGARPRPRRRWPWVVLTLVPIVVIVGAGIALVVLLRAG